MIRLGIRGFNPKLKKAAERLDGLRTPEGEPIPPNTLAELRRDMARRVARRPPIPIFGPLPKSAQPVAMSVARRKPDADQHLARPPLLTRSLIATGRFCPWPAPCASDPQRTSRRMRDRFRWRFRVN
ncbi:hypothetical protein IVA83_35940 [Bradyrhizobium sp. 143]|nr:hypothetical protein [Bradyrhizobium sp. 143]MCK1728216.1 hypothetical protein [Bradyrhizobium sp. 142]